MYTGNSKLVTKHSENHTVYPCVYRELKFIDKPKLTCIGLSLCIQGTPNNNHHSANNDAVYPCVYRELTFNKIIINPDTGLSLCIQGTL